MAEKIEDRRKTKVIEESKVLIFGKYILAGILMLLGVNGANVWNDPVGALTTEIRMVREKIDSIDGIAQRVETIHNDVSALKDTVSSNSEKMAALQEAAAKVKPKGK